MQIQEYLNILRKRGWIIILLAVITTVGAVVFSLVQTPEYRSSIYLNVLPARLDWGLQETIKVLMRNYAGEIQSSKILLKVMDRLQLDLTPDQMKEKLRVRPIESDFLIQIDVDDYDSILAAQIAQTTAQVFVEDISAYMLDQDRRDRVEVSIREDARPGVLHFPKWKVNAFAGGVLGILLGGVVIFVLEWIEADTIHTSLDVERHIETVVLGTIPAMPGGSRRRPSQ